MHLLTVHKIPEMNVHEIKKTALFIIKIQMHDNVSIFCALIMELSYF